MKSFLLVLFAAFAVSCSVSEQSGCDVETEEIAMSSTKVDLQIQTIEPTGSTHSATVVFLHGSGSNGDEFLELIRSLVGDDWKFPHIKVIVPTAPSRPYTLLKGECSHVWFDRFAMSKQANECRDSLRTAYEYIKDIIKSENDNGIPTKRIVVGGFSMGGALALHSGYHLYQNLAGIFACSSFLSDDSTVFETLQTQKPQSHSCRLPKLLMFHGESDSYVPVSWGKETFDELAQLGVDGEFKPLKNTNHELKAKELRDIHQWVLKRLPPLDSDVDHKL